MKREIICTECRAHYKSLCEFAIEFKEYVRTVEGKLRNQCMCDSCGNPIPAGKFCYAVSICRDVFEYHPWEQEYLYVPKKQDA